MISLSGCWNCYRVFSFSPAKRGCKCVGYVPFMQYFEQCDLYSVQHVGWGTFPLWWAKLIMELLLDIRRRWILQCMYKFSHRMIIRAGGTESRVWLCSVTSIVSCYDEFQILDGLRTEHGLHQLTGGTCFFTAACRLKGILLPISSCVEYWTTGDFFYFVRCFHWAKM